MFQPEDNIFTSAIKHWTVVPWTSANRRLRQSMWQAQIQVVPKDSVSISRAQDDVMAALKKCHETVHEMGAPRVATFVKLSSRTDREVSGDAAIASVEAKLEIGPADDDAGGA